VIPPLGPIMLKDRISMIFLRYGHLDVIDGAFVLVDQNGVRTHIPVGSVACWSRVRAFPMLRSS
jgi:CRISPR-associated protein Cas1